MKRVLLLLVPVLLAATGFSQLKIKNKKYPSLLWEITGNGLKKPSYLFGTMHVSSKIAFHLSDSFYLGIRNADVVALETNPESWQEDMSQYDLGDYSYYRRNMRYDEYPDDLPSDYLNIRSLRFTKYEKLMEAALFSEPSVINNLLYRSYSENSSDFEEDTYLDMYIYQVGKKLGKKIAGVENYGESMKLMIEAYRDAAKEKNRKEKSYDYDVELSPMKLQEAYRSGNLDLLDSINRVNSYSDAFDEKFLFRRNEIQAQSIDSILKRSTLFVGVGAAHLPGQRGVIEILRRMGYKLRPIVMGSRDSKHKDLVEKIRVPVSFSQQTSVDGFYKVDIPGKFYDYNDFGILDQRQYADMANGSYYMVTRVRTDGLFWGHTPADVANKIDSVLYENVPGKILSKTPITKNGYPGFDISNRTRRGDHQRYQIFITPFEVLFFKMSGTSDYVKNGEEAKKFFSSIQLKEFKNGGWKKYQPSYGGFNVELPTEPLEVFGEKVRYDSEDRSSCTHFTIIRTDIHNYSFAEEDTFDLALLDESYASSEFIDKQISRKLVVHKGYPALNATYKHKDGSVSMVKYLIQGPHYYALIAHAAKENPSMNQFLNSFEIAPYVYKELKERVDTSMKYTVKTTWFPKPKENKLELPDDYMYDEEDEEEDYDAWYRGDYQSRLIANDTTGEKIAISYYTSGRYYYSPDSSKYHDFNVNFSFGNDSSWIIRSKKKSMLRNDIHVWDVLMTDSNSSRVMKMKMFYKDGYGFNLMTQLDTLSGESSFVKSFFDNFLPADTIKGTSPFQKKTTMYFNDLFGTDSVQRKRAIRSIAILEIDSTDFPSMKKAIEMFNWTDKKYLDRKKEFIQKLEEVRTKEASNYLKQLYFAAGDTVELQYAALETLLRQKTQYSYNLFRDIITSDPPVLNMSVTSTTDYYYPTMMNRPYVETFSNNRFMDELFDTLQLTQTILPDLLPLMNLDDYESGIMSLLRTMVDSNMVKPSDYSIYLSKFLIEARQALKKQAISERTKSIEKAEEDKDDSPDYPYYYGTRTDIGNESLISYATLLLPFWDSNPNVAPLFTKLLTSSDKTLKYNTVQLLLRNKKAVPDSMFNYFASLDEYRYDLYKDLSELKMLDKFPKKYANHLDLAKSELVSESRMGAPDSIQFVDKVKASVKKREGYVYFFKYKVKKDDSWKLATVGLVNPDPNKYLFEERSLERNFSFMEPGWSSSYQFSSYDFTEFKDLRLKEDEPISEQLNKELKKMLYSKRKSAKLFYNRDDPRYDYMPEYIHED